MKKMLGLLIAAVWCLAAVACDGNGGDAGVTPTATVTEAVTPTEAAAPTGAVTGTVTPTATPTPVPASNLAELVARNRELHEKIETKRTVNPLGTARPLTEQEKTDRSYGITRHYPLTVHHVEATTGSTIEQVWESDYTYLLIDGLRDDAVEKKINDRLESVVRTMMDPNYLPDIAGIMAIVKERGLPKARVHEYAEYATDGLLSVKVDGTWYWEEERVFANDEELQKFCESVDWAYPRYEILDGYYFVWNSPVRISYVLNRTSYMNIDLATGDETALSDFFPEGFDYLSYVRETAEKESQYEFWFEHSDNDLGAWEYYDEGKEYDSNVALKITGDEQFYVDSYAMRFLTNQGKCANIQLPGEVLQGHGELYEVNPEFIRTSIGQVDFYIWDYYEETDAQARKNKMLVLDEFRAVPDGNREITAEVTRQRDLPDWEQYSGEKWVAKAREDFSDKAIVEYAKTIMAEWDQTDTPDRDVEMTLRSAEVYPNGYYCTSWDVCYKGETDQTYWSLTLWVKDGKILSQADMIDVSCEELLTEIIAGLRVGNRRSGKPVATPAEAAAAAKVLSPYFPEDLLPFRGTEEGWTGPWFAEGSYDEVFEELAAVLPQELWIQMCMKIDQKLYFADPYLIYKHLRMYEGYSFE